MTVLLMSTIKRRTIFNKILVSYQDTNSSGAEIVPAATRWRGVATICTGQRLASGEEEEERNSHQDEQSHQSLR